MKDWKFDLQLFAGVDDDDEDLVAGDPEDEEEIDEEEEDVSVDYFRKSDEQEEQENQDDEEEDEFDSATEKAFAKRLAAEREKIKQELRDELPKPDLQRQLQQSKPLSKQELKKELEELADEWGLTTEAVEVLYQQQLALNQQDLQIKQANVLINDMKENVTKSEAMDEITRSRKINPNLPAFDEAKISSIRKEFKQKYGVNLPWNDAYKQFVAEEALNGNLTRNTQRNTINNIKNRNKATTKIGPKGKAARKPDIWDLSDKQFEQMQERALRGEFKAE